MEIIKDFFSSLKDRVSNPLISSFLISWIIANWRISYGLIFYDISELKLSGYQTYEEIVTTNFNVYNMFYIPLAISLLYTFCFPYVKAFVNEYQASIIAKNDSKILEITKEGTMSVKKYIKIKEAFEIQSVALKRIEEEEFTYIQEKTNLDTELHNLRLSKAELDINYSKIKNEHEQIININFKNSELESDITLLPKLWIVKFKNIFESTPDQKRSNNKELGINILNQKTLVLSGWFFSNLNNSVLARDIHCRIDFYNLNVYKKQLSLILSFDNLKDSTLEFSYITLIFEKFTPTSGSTEGFLIFNDVISPVEIGFLTSISKIDLG